MHTPTDTSTPVSQVPLHFRASQHDIAQMLLAGVIAPVHLTLGELPPGSITYYFSVAEHAKHRRRPIMWPKAFLLNSTYHSEFSLCSVEKYVQAVHDGVSAVTFDLAASFWQVILPAETQLYIVGVDGQVYRILRLPYGIDAASEIVHLLVSEVARLAAMTASVRTYVHIDNVMAVGSLLDTTAFAAAFKSLATSFAMTLNDEPGNLPAPTTTFAGIRFDFVGKSVRLADRFVERLVVPPRPYSWSALESWIGKLLCAAAILGLRLYRFHYLVKYYRRRLSDLAKARLLWSATAALPPFALRDIRLLHGLLFPPLPTQVRIQQQNRTALGDGGPLPPKLGKHQLRQTYLANRNPTNDCLKLSQDL
jgi:hypothetical protein